MEKIEWPNEAHVNVIHIIIQGQFFSLTLRNGMTVKTV